MALWLFNSRVVGVVMAGYSCCQSLRAAYDFIDTNGSTPIFGFVTHVRDALFCPCIVLATPETIVTFDAGLCSTY